MAAEITLDLVKRFPSNGPTDPIRYYRRPLTGWLFRERINLGLRMLRDLRFYAKAVDGQASGATQTAIRDYQRMAGLKETGEVNKALFESLKEMRKLMVPPAAN